MRANLTILNITLSILTVLSALFGLWSVPWNQEIAVHWSLSAAPDNFLLAPIAFSIPPLLCFVLFALPQFLIRKLGPEEIEAAGKLYRIGMSVGFMAALFVQAIILAVALNYPVDPVRSAVIFVGFVLIFLGNNLPKSRRNKIAGLRMRSTIKSEENWVRTHHFAGKIYILTGIIALLTGALAVPTPLNLVITILCAIIPELAAVVYSRSICHDEAQGQ